MKSNLFALNGRDFVTGLAIAVVVAFFGVIQQALSEKGFDFASYDWANIANVVGTTFMAYLVTNFGLDTENKVLGKF